MVSEHEIRIRSYLLWEEAGRPQGRDIDFWLRAEADLKAETRDAATAWGRYGRTVIVPSVAVSTPLRRTVSMRVPPRERIPAATAATR
ncbi:MAG: DUF2934 domain-containing protein [Rhizomicrobium sp.]